MNEDEKKYYEFSFIVNLTNKDADYLLSHVKQMVEILADQEFVGGYVTADLEVEDEKETEH